MSHHGKSQTTWEHGPCVYDRLQLATTRTARSLNSLTLLHALSISFFISISRTTTMYTELYCPVLLKMCDTARLTVRCRGVRRVPARAGPGLPGPRRSS